MNFTQSTSQRLGYTQAEWSPAKLNLSENKLQQDVKGQLESGKSPREIYKKISGLLKDPAEEPKFPMYRTSSTASEITRRPGLERTSTLLAYEQDLKPDEFATKEMLAIAAWKWHQEAHEDDEMDDDDLDNNGMEFDEGMDKQTNEAHRPFVKRNRLRRQLSSRQDSLLQPATKIARQKSITARRNKLVASSGFPIKRQDSLQMSDDMDMFDDSNKGPRVNENAEDWIPLSLQQNLETSSLLPPLHSLGY